MSQQLTIPFSARGADGTIQVSVRPVTDPAATGFDLLPLPFALDKTMGFPACEAAVDFPRDGYAGYLGWVQFLTITSSSGQILRELDLVPFTRDSGVPFLTFGSRPTFFDAPANPDRPDEVWRASTFLTLCPDVAFTPTLDVVAGFTWGYQLVAGKPTVTPPRRLEARDGTSFADVLSNACPRWTIAGASGDLGPN